MGPHNVPLDAMVLKQGCNMYLSTPFIYYMYYHSDFILQINCYWGGGRIVHKEYSSSQIKVFTYHNYI
jgi:hypothetical protein